MFVEERGHKGHVELCVSTNDISGSHKLPAAETVGLSEHALCSLREILLLETDTDTQTQIYAVLGKTGSVTLDTGQPLKGPKHQMTVQNIRVSTDQDLLMHLCILISFIQ